MFGQYISRYSKSLTTILQKSVKFSPITTPVTSLLEPSTINLIRREQPVNKFYANTTPLIPCCQSTLISLRRFTTESDIESGNVAKGDLADRELDVVVVNSSTSKQYIEEERQGNIEEQERRMNDIIIHGVGETSNDEELRKAVMDIFRSIGFNTDEAVIKSAFRFQSGDVLCQLSERKWVNIVFACNKKNRKNIDGSVWINQSLCLGFAEIDYNLRRLKGEGKIRKNWIYHGRPKAQLFGSEKWVEITHLQDLVELGLIDQI